ncbi:receptor kinase-like protein Xa21 [Citrus clementina]|uniref:receptor kinase-like protein Xa21 n=1 Tax=Citrus clementina TaxID=85681 RepID=UPI000CED7AF1|nr:receptor kinase-like protein Xa21 [Citrus x clementina]
MKQQFPMISHAELSKATNNFSPANKIREGGFNIVYNVAMKVANLKQKEASRSFAAEFNALRNIRHRNLIKIITICSSIDFEGFDFKAIVYEYMQNGNLEQCLTQRVNIAIDVAFAIEYLRHHCQPSIVHGDLKPSNILLDQDVVTHVGDLGLAKFLYGYEPGTTAETASSSIGINGTVGYVAPVRIGVV